MATSNPDPPAPVPAHPEAVATSDPMAETLALLQPWIDYVPKGQRRLGLFIFLAFLVHVAVLHFVRIDATRAELRRQARIHVAVESPAAASMESSSGDNFWDRLTDPRLFLLPLASSTSQAEDAAPGFAAMNPSIGSQELPPTAPPENYQFNRPSMTPLAQRVETAMAPPRQPFVYDESPPVIAAKTTVEWDGALAARQPVGVADLPSPVSDTSLAPTKLRVAIDADGTVEHALVEQSCGSGRLDLDQEAILAVRKVRFRPEDQAGLVWGQVTVFWHYSATPSEEVVPTPPTGQ
jgi:TonB family protein